MSLRLRKFVIVIILLGCCVPLAMAQQQPPATNAETPAEAPTPKVKDPVMKSVFWNTLMGSAWGALMGANGALADPNADFREAVILGTTIGGLMGYGFGIVLVIRGLSFDSNIIPDSPLPRLKQQQVPAAAMDFDGLSPAPLLAQHSGELRKPRGWVVNAIILDLRF